MYLLYADETNMDLQSSDFLIYGGVVIPAEVASNISADITQVRLKYGYPDDAILKFNTKERPAHITPSIHKSIKQEVIEVAAKYGVKLLVYMVHHGVSGDTHKAREFGINSICFHFNAFLHREKSNGLVMLDNFSGSKTIKIIQEKFLLGVTEMPYSKSLQLDRILGYNLSAIGSSHFSSIVDIVLGSFRYAINNKANVASKKVVSVLLSQLRPLFLMCPSGGDRIDEISLFFSPKVIKAQIYRNKYQSLHDFFQENNMIPEQEISESRLY